MKPKNRCFYLSLPALIFFCLLAQGCGARNHAQPDANAGKTAPAAGAASADPNEKVIAALRSDFGNNLTAKRSRNPFYFTGDFNGDGKQDIAIIVEAGKTDSLVAGVATLNLRPPDKAKTAADDSSKNRAAIAIIHGDKDGWSSATPAGKFLLLDLADEQLQVIEHDPANESLLKAKGDAIFSSSEKDGISIIYWDGQTYRLDQQ
jgi:hypothetical protein